MKRFNRFFKYFSKNKPAFIKYSIISVIAGILELCGVALTYPFILTVLNKQNNHSVTSPMFIGAAIIMLFLAKNIFMVFYTYFQAKFVISLEKDINIKFVQYFLSGKYKKVSKVSYAQKINILNFITKNVINNYILRLLSLNVNIFIFGLISLFLIIKYPLAMLMTIFFASIILICQNKLFKQKLLHNSQFLSESSKIANEKGNDILLNTKGVKVSGNEYYFFNKYKTALSQFFEYNAKLLFYNTVPPYITEPFIIFMLFILLGIISLQNFESPDKLVASFAVLVSAIFRLTPAISRIQTNINGIHSCLPLVDEFLEYCEEFDLNNVSEIEKTKFYNFKDSIELKNVSFGYETNKQILNNISFKINKGEFIGIAGLSGSGKTTLTDIIAGLYEPSSGEIIIDGKKQKANLKIGYIPQEYITINGTIRENVTFGSTDINDERVIDVLKKAQLYDFIVANCSEGINANPFVDSQGLSQGQKQRLAIARALYSDPDILIFDEATSSLDLQTENEICRTLESLKGDKTIIAIAHRLSTIKFADRIIFVQDSGTVDIDTFDNLELHNPKFKKLVEFSKIKEL